MKKEKIEELFDIHTSEPNAMNLNDFAYAINQAELEWYERLDYNMECMSLVSDIKEPFEIYHKEIKEKIKGLENEN